MEGDPLEYGRRYKLKSRPWDNSYIDAKLDPKGDWIYAPVERELDHTADWHCDINGLLPHPDGEAICKHWRPKSR
jgi:hypothetical protein